MKLDRSAPHLAGVRGGSEGRGLPIQVVLYTDSVALFLEAAQLRAGNRLSSSEGPFAPCCKAQYRCCDVAQGEDTALECRDFAVVLPVPHALSLDCAPALVEALVKVRHVTVLLAEHVNLVPSVHFAAAEACCGE